MKKTALLIGLAFTSLSACVQTDQFITAAYDGMKFQEEKTGTDLFFINRNRDRFIFRKLLLASMALNPFSAPSSKTVTYVMDGFISNKPRFTTD